MSANAITHHKAIHYTKKILNNMTLYMCLPKYKRKDILINKLWDKIKG